MDRPIIFFDGVCGLCNRFVDWVIRHDPEGLFLFAPLQGENARKINHLQLTTEEGDLTSVILCDEKGSIYRASAAVLRILIRLGGIWKIFGIFLILPRSLRDALYYFIARRRYQWFGKKESCRIPSPQETQRFLP